MFGRYDGVGAVDGGVGTRNVRVGAVGGPFVVGVGQLQEDRSIAALGEGQALGQDRPGRLVVEGGDDPDQGLTLGPTGRGSPIAVAGNGERAIWAIRASYAGPGWPLL